MTKQEYALCVAVLKEAIKDLDSQEWWQREQMFTAKGLQSAKPIEVLEDLQKHFQELAE